VLNLLNQDLIWWLSGLSLATIVVMLLAVPWVLARLPQDYFDRPQRQVWRASGQEPLAAVIFGLFKNLLGLVLLVIGFVLLFMPGQGLLTMLLGLVLMNFPGKYQLERWLVRRPGMLATLNWMRSRGGSPPFSLSDD